MIAQSNLDGKLALVTGASSGIGAATARSLVAAGAKVVLAARRLERLEALAEELRANSPLGQGAAEPLALDVCDAKAVAVALEARAFDLVVVNAGLGIGMEPIQNGDVEEWSTMIDTNIKGLLHVVRTTLPSMLERGAGDMVLLGSIAGRTVYPNGHVYCATKHAVHAIYQALRQDAGASGVRFTTVDPGMVETGFSEVRFRGDKQAAKQVYAGMHALQPEDVADAILYAVTRPAHVNIGEIVLWPTDQASATKVRRS
ncbi:MAG: 3-hydroxy acid dehydrogenase/malonic semialdehyde reductase [Planctomycetota bacterium]|jgi:3-hydroxy acid dehydrogenase/malonic semialdehyde reductase